MSDSNIFSPSVSTPGWSQDWYHDEAELVIEVTGAGDNTESNGQHQASAGNLSSSSARSL
jgi:hypothetical protein